MINIALHLPNCVIDPVLVNILKEFNLTEESSSYQDQISINDADEKYKINTISDIGTLSDNTGTVILPPYTPNLFDTVSILLKKSVHILFTGYPDFSETEIVETEKLRAEANAIVLIFNPLIFDPAVQSVIHHINTPVLIEHERIRNISNSGEMKSVLNEIAEDIGLLLTLNKANIKKQYPTAIQVLSEVPDVIHTSILLDNGCTINLSANYISDHREHHMAIHQPGCTISIDLLKSKAQMITGSGMQNSGNRISTFSSTDQSAFSLFLHHYLTIRHKGLDHDHDLNLYLKIMNTINEIDAKHFSSNH